MPGSPTTPTLDRVRPLAFGPVLGPHVVRDSTACACLCHFSAISALLSRCWAGPGSPHWSSPMNSALIFLGVGGGGTVTELLREFPQQRPFLSGRGVGPNQVPPLRFSGVAVGYGI